MSLYAQYIKERTNKSMIETDKGYVLYSFPDKETVYLEDLYVLPEHRTEGHCRYLDSEVAVKAKEAGCSKMITSVVPAAINSTISLKVAIACGYTLDSSADNFILFSKVL